MTGSLREHIWNSLSRHRAATYPTPPHGHHPNFVGAAKASELLVSTVLFQEAQTILAGPDQVLKPLREAALRAGKRLIMPHPDKKHQYLLLTGILPALLKRVREISQYGELIDLQNTAIDLVLVGSVAIDESLSWLGKGYGFPPKSLAVAAPWATIVHPLQVLEALPESEHSLALAATPSTLLKPKGTALSD